MAQIKTTKVGVTPEDGVQGEREKLWKEYVEQYRVKNPTKYAAKMEAKGFDTIPASFQGVVSEHKTLKGVIRIIS